MSTEIARRDTVEESVSIGKLGDIFVKSGFFKDTRDQYQAVVKILYGKEMGFSPVVSMLGISIIDGKPALSANLMGTLVKRSGKYNYRVVESTATRCEIEFFENKESVGRSVFTMDDAKTAGLTAKRNWQQYPKAMLFSRALSAGVKLHCPDVSASPLYVPEELGAEVNEDGDVTKLPKSASNVEVIEKDIQLDLGSPVMEAARTEEGVGNQPGPASQASQQDGRQIIGGGHGHASDEAAGRVGANIPASAAPAESKPEGPYIGTGQAANFHRECRAAVRPAKSMEADNLTYQYLLDNGYVNAAGEPSASMIPASGWLSIRDKAVAWLKVQ